MSRKASKVLTQSGVIPYRVENGKIEVLLITSRSRQEWVIPKGGIVNGMSPPDSAAKEAWEEAGVIGEVDVNQLGTYMYGKRGNIYQVQMFLLRVEKVLEDWQEASQRQRQWLDVNKAIERIEKPSLKQILEGAFLTKGENTTRLLELSVQLNSRVR